MDITKIKIEDGIYNIKDLKSRNDIENIQNNINNLQEQINNLVLQGGNPDSSSAEITQARVNTLNLTFPTLNDRISYIEKTMPFDMIVASNVDFNLYLTPR